MMTGRMMIAITIDSAHPVLDVHPADGCSDPTSQFPKSDPQDMCQACQVTEDAAVPKGVYILRAVWLPRWWLAGGAEGSANRVQRTKWLATEKGPRWLESAAGWEDVIQIPSSHPRWRTYCT